MRLLPLIFHLPPDGTLAPPQTFVRMVTYIPAITILVLSLMWESGRANAEERSTHEHEQSAAHHTVTGTLATLDLKVGKGMLKTDLGKPIFFDLTRPDLFRSISVGQHVSIVLNQKGQAVKVMETPPAELITPPDQ